MKKTILLLITLVSLNQFGQKKQIEDSYQEYFKIPREALYVHTNKTTYLTGEEIWFKAYAFDKKNSLPSLKTRNIYFGIYDSSGKEINNKLFLAKNGSAKGSLKIDSTFTSGIYYLKAYTNWMKNFNEDDSFIQKIKILDSSNNVVNKNNPKTNDLQFLPEGGHIVSGIKNTIGFKYINNEGKGDFISGFIYNQKNELITSFKSNSLGMGKFSLNTKSGETYTAKFNIDDEDYSINLPKTDEIGLAINTNNNKKDRLIISFLTNKESLKRVYNDSLKLMIHRDGLLKTIKFKMSKEYKLIQIPKKDLFKGINILTILNSEDKPILERLIFNDYSFKKHKLSISQIESEFDSINYSLKSVAKLNENENINLSISVLPSETISYNKNNNIISSLLLKPYIKGNIENPNFYFREFNSRDKYNLDIMLLTQGWSRYSWDNINKGAPELIYDFEEGISASGNINSSIKNIESIVMFPTKHNSSQFINFDSQGKFNFSNIILETGEIITFSALSKRGKLKTPAVIINPILKSGKNQIDRNQLDLIFDTSKKTNLSVPKNFIGNEYEELEEINIVAKKKERLIDPQFPNATITQVTKEIALRYNGVLDFIAYNGFNVFDGVELGKVRIESRARGQRVSPVVFLNNVIINDLNILQTLPTDRIDKILIDKSGVGLGIAGGNSFGGVIKITTRNSSVLNQNISFLNTYATKIKNGFEPVKEFYTPKYPSYRIKSFKDYGIIHWTSDATLSNFNDFKFKTVDTRLDEIKFFIEGISSDGKLFSQVITLDSSLKESKIN